MSNKILLALVSVLLALFLASRARADDLRLLELDEMSMEYAKIANNRSAYYPYVDPGEDGEYWDYMISTKFDLALAKYGNYGLRWRNKVEGISSNVQFRSVAWDFRWGLQLGEKVELFFDHRSAHVLDAAPAEPRTYDLKNFYGAELTFYRRDR